MQRISCFIHLGIFWAGVMSAIVLVPGDQVVTVSVGGSTTLRCTMEGGTISNYYTNWYRKTQGDILTFIYGEGSGYGSNFQDRFQAKTDNSNNQAVLKILKASMSDEGFYYCAIDD
uniref:T cell receptor delta variable 2 n=1 Tax=Loxodonta africana TaxID=9785 RepID=G3UD95_LOXAF